MKRIHLGILSIFLSVLPIVSGAKEKWPEEAKVAYIERCAESLVSQGLPRVESTEYCSCTTSGMEAEFGKKEYMQMMQAQPNPKGNEYDRRLFQVFKACKPYMPRK